MIQLEVHVSIKVFFFKFKMFSSAGKKKLLVISFLSDAHFNYGSKICLEGEQLILTSEVAAFKTVFRAIKDNLC